jgi:hypothetical protein
MDTLFGAREGGFPLLGSHATKFNITTKQYTCAVKLTASIPPSKSHYTQERNFSLILPTAKTPHIYHNWDFENKLVLNAITLQEIQAMSSK